MSITRRTIAATAVSIAISLAGAAPANAGPESNGHNCYGVNTSAAVEYPYPGYQGDNASALADEQAQDDSAKAQRDSWANCGR